MKAICRYNSASSLKEYERDTLSANQLGRFGATANSSYPLKIGKEYLIMGIIVFEKYTAFLVDDGVVLTAPCYLFEVTDSRLNSQWSFRFIEPTELIYPYVQAVFGYHELANDKNAYESLILDMDEDATLLYFKRKLEGEKMQH
jgi:hypothetical protein